MENSFVDNFWKAFSVSINWEFVWGLGVFYAIILAWAILFSLTLEYCYIEARPIRWYGALGWLLLVIVGYALSYAVFTTYIFN